MRPKRVDILGKVHGVEFQPTGHPDLVEDGEPLSGAIIHEQQRIAIEEGQALEQEQDTIVHEIFHGIERAMDIKNLPETAIQRLATGWLAVLKHNPKLASYLRRKSPNGSQGSN